MNTAIPILHDYLQSCCQRGGLDTIFWCTCENNSILRAEEIGKCSWSISLANVLSRNFPTTRMLSQVCPKKEAIIWSWCRHLHSVQSFHGKMNNTRHQNERLTKYLTQLNVSNKQRLGHSYPIMNLVENPGPCRYTPIKPFGKRPTSIPRVKSHSNGNVHRSYHSNRLKLNVEK